MNDLELSKRIAELAKQAGGRAYFVGGFVRDELMAVAASGLARCEGDPGAGGYSRQLPADAAAGAEADAGANRVAGPERDAGANRVARTEGDAGTNRVAGPERDAVANRVARTEGDAVANGLPSDHQDKDIEVHGLEPEALKGVLSKLGEVLSYGSSFGIYGLVGHEIDIAMPRKERAVRPGRSGNGASGECGNSGGEGQSGCGASGADAPGTCGSSGAEPQTPRGHRDFVVNVDPFLGTTEAARRRDFTINAMMKDILTGEITDPFGGREDLAAGIIRHVDDRSFAEDPLRVLRCAQFAARFTRPAADTSEAGLTEASGPAIEDRGSGNAARRINFTVAPETVALCKSMDISALSRERVEGELKKALLQAVRPSVFFETLRRMDQLDVWFPEISRLIGLPQDPIYHPEGDVWVHTMQVIDRAAKFRAEVSEPYRFMLLALLHDVGKAVSTEEKNGRIHAYGHEVLGLPLAEQFLRRITGEEAVVRYVLNMIPLHMKPNMKAFSKASLKSTNHMFDEAAAPKDLIYMAMSDKPVMSGTTPFAGDSGFLFERLAAYEETMAKPFVSGRDLVEAGLEPGEYFSELLAYAHKLRLAGIEKESALKQILGHRPKKLKTDK